MSRPVKAGQAYVQLGVKDELAKGLAAARKKLEKFAAGITRIGQKLFFVGATITSAFIGAARAFSIFGDNVAKTASRLGIGIGALQELQYAAGRGGVEVNVLTNSLRRMIRRTAEAAQGTGAAVKAFQELGLDPAAMKLMPVEQQLGMIADALNNVGNHSDKLRLAFQIFDTEGAMMLSVLQGGSAGLAAMAAQARALGVVLSEEAAQDAETFADAWGDLMAQMRGVTNQIGAAVVPILVSIIEAVKPIIKSIIDWVKANQELVQNVMLWVAAFTAAMAVLVGVGTAIGAIILSIMALKIALGLLIAPFVFLFKLVVLKGIFGGISAAIGGLIAILNSLAGLIPKVGMILFRLFGKKLLSVVGSSLKGIGSILAKLLIAPFKWAFKWLGNVIKNFGKNFKESINGFLAKGFSLITSVFGSSLAGIAALIYAFLAGVGKALLGSFEAALLIVIATSETFISIMSTIGKVVIAVFKQAGLWVWYLVKAIWNIISTIGKFTGLTTLVVGTFKLIAGLIISVFSRAWDVVWGATKTTFSAIGGLISTALSKGMSVLKTFGSFAKTVFSSFFTFIKDGFMVLITGWGELFSNLSDNLGILLSNATDNFKTMFGGITDAIMSGEFGLAWEIVTTGLKATWVQFVEDLRIVWNQFTIDIVKWADEAARAMVGIWRKSSQKIAEWLADRFYEWSVGDNNVLSLEERNIIRDQSLNDSYDGMEGSANEAIGKLTAALESKLGSTETDPATAAKIAALQAQLEKLRGDAADARETAKKAREESRRKGDLPDFDFDGMDLSGAAEVVKPETIEQGSAESAEKIRDLVYAQEGYQQQMLTVLNAIARSNNNIANKPTVGMA